MGCNFYTNDGKHIGKRSAAGYYCWDCNVTLNKLGEKWVHYSSEWHEKCPICGKRPKRNECDASMRELGFNTSKPKRKRGVKSCSSFSWAMDIKEICPFDPNMVPIKDEYNRIYTYPEFLDVLEECPIMFYHIGEEFS